MNILDVHHRITGDYANDIRSFVTIADDELRRRVEQHLKDGHLRDVLFWASRVNAVLSPERKRFAYLPFTLHQFFSQTGDVYVKERRFLRDNI